MLTGIKCISLAFEGVLFRRGRDTWILLDFVKESLECLNSLGYKLVITSEYVQGAEETLSVFKIKHFFQDFFWKNRVNEGISFFYEIHKILALESKHILHLGPNLQKDYLCPKNAGWQSIWISEEAKNIYSLACLGSLHKFVLLLIKNRNNSSRLKKQNFSIINNFKELPSVYLNTKVCAKSINNLLNTILEQRNSKISLDQIILDNWTAIVGLEWAKKCQAQRIVDNKKLVVMVKNAVYKQELLFMKSMILAKIKKLPNCQSISEISVISL